MGGVMVLTAGIAPSFERGDFAVLVIGYVVMRVFLVLQWLRASRSGGPAGRAARLYASGVFGVQVLWCLWLWLVPDGPLRLVLLVVLVLAELAVPVIAETVGSTPWHPHHITERYGLFTIIVLGESLLASTNALIEAHGESHATGQLITLALLALVITAGLWWVYFWPEPHRTITSMFSSTLFGYGHYVVFAAAGAVSVGIEVGIEAVGHEAASGPRLGFAIAAPVAIFLLAVWLTAYRGSADRVVNLAMPAASALILAAPLFSAPYVSTVVLLAGLVAVLVVRNPVTEDAAAG